MRALIWLTEDGWQATVDAARDLVPPDAEVTLLHVSPADVEEVAHGLRASLLGRRPPPPPKPPPSLRAISDEEADALLADAAARLGRPASRERRRGRVEREVVGAARAADLLVLARDGDRAEPGPHSLTPVSRFVVDHAPCHTLLISGS